MQSSTDRTEQDGLSSDAEDGGIVTRRAGKSPGGGEGGGGGGRKSPGGGTNRRRRAGKGYMDMIYCLASQRYSGNYFNFKFSDILRVLVEIRGIFENEKMLIECQTPVVVVGDLHGQYTDLLRAFNLFNVGTGAKVRPGYLTQRFVFTGDYVDRGKQSLEVIMLLFLLKIKFKKSYLLLRGNHECKAINRVYGFKAELEERFDKDESNKLFHMFNEVFTYMPLACLVSGSILCMHGGIAPSATCLDDIRNIPKPLIDPPEDEIGCDLLWADPMIGLKGHRPNSVRGVSKHFGEDVLEDFMKRLDLTLVVRGHQMMMNGFNFFHDKRLVTVFTASSYYPDRANNGVVMYINREGRCGFKILTPQEEKGEGRGDSTGQEKGGGVGAGGKVFRGAHDDANAYDTGYVVYGEEKGAEKKGKKKSDSKRSEKEEDDKKGKPRKSDSKRSEKEKEILKPIKSLFQNLK
ncbi:hypothetical protein PRIPAC_74625 [Pristionchus pacificus]|uniref:Serine/threonine-protein phosphatase n=1 Tax=Pristionchus pacificus TaxID=54126 RepID=A0A2A6C0D2_PRIPA|nr:hypothetical protein PRIPAC_74625 [Pristionchus pacificus]|eukprot:PDM71712.1 Calcineurin-like phosphoesterase [Pristionchus pacificus]